MRCGAAVLLLAAVAAGQERVRTVVEEPARFPGDDPAAVAALRAARPVVPVANGRVFAYVGPGEPGNRLFGITGPHYQTRGNHEPLGAFGECWVEVRHRGRRLVPRRRSWSAIAGTSGAVSEERFPGGVVLTVRDLADPERPVLLRRVRLEAGALDREELELVAVFGDRPQAAERCGEAVCKRYERGEGRVYHLRAWWAGAAPVHPEPGELAVALPGDGMLDLVLATGRDPAACEVDVDGDDLERAALSAGAAARRGALACAPASPLAETVAAVRELTLAQRARPGGAVAPMVSFRGVWARDSNGALKTLLWNGWFGRARELLEYYRAASALAGATRREFPLDLPVDEAPELSAAAWGRTGTDRCEVPSWIVLQHLWYWDRSGDAGLIRAAWPWLRRNALHQELHDTDLGRLQTFNGDETWLHGAFYSLFPQKDVWPNELPAANGWSAYSLAAYVAAQEAMVRLAPVAGRPGQAAEHRERARAARATLQRAFWLEDRRHYAPSLSRATLVPHAVPYAPVNLGLVRLGVLGAEEPRARADRAAVVALLGRPDGLVRMTPSVPWFTGAVPGDWLHVLAAADHPLAWKAFEAVLGCRSPSGCWVEVHRPDRPAHGYGDGRYANRLRPWESGMNLDALLGFVTGARFRDGRGLTLRPRRPPVGLERLGPLRVGDTRLELRWPEDGGTVTVHHLGGPACTVNGRELVPEGRLAVPLAGPGGVEPRRTVEAGTALPPRGGRRRLVLTAGNTAPPARADTVVVDTGLPFAPHELAAYLFDGGGRAFDEVVVEPMAVRADRTTMKPVRFWEDPGLVAAFERFRREGGRIERRRFLTDWWVCGPFPNPESRGLLEERRPIVEAFDADAVFPWVGGRARWWRVEERGGRVDLHPPAGPRDGICCFARTVIEAAEAGTVELLLGTDDGCRVWLDGERVFEDIAHRHLTPDEFRIPLELHAGRNVLVIGVEDRTGAFGLMARLVDR